MITICASFGALARDNSIAFSARPNFRVVDYLLYLYSRVPREMISEVDGTTRIQGDVELDLTSLSSERASQLKEALETRTPQRISGMNLDLSGLRIRYREDRKAEMIADEVIVVPSSSRMDEGQDFSDPSPGEDPMAVPGPEAAGSPSSPWVDSALAGTCARLVRPTDLN